MNKKRVQERCNPEKIKNDVRENYNDIVERIEKEYRWESDEIDRFRELKEKIEKMTLNRETKLRNYFEKIIENQHKVK